LSGIKAHTIRMWEKRHGVLNPQRNQGNNRLYSVNELNKILNFSLLNNNGHKVSRLSALTHDELQGKINGLVNKEERQQKAVNELILCMHQLDPEGFERTLDDCLAVWSLEILINEIVYTFLQKTGLFWGGSRLTEEHFVVTALRSKIILGIEKSVINEKKSKTILLFLPEAGQLDLMLLYTKYILRIRGFQVLYMGNDITIDNLKTVIQLKQPDYIFTYLSKRTKFKINELSSIMHEVIPESKLVIVNNRESRQIKAEYTNVVLPDYEDALSYISEESLN
ncbi:MAG: MerR family transcriptional regulator, partial [Bacteroidota bacterium]